MDKNKVQDCVERLCMKGCTDVLETIAALEQNLSVAETSELSTEETQAVLLELKNIMAVYKR